MSLSDLASLGSFVSGVAVLISLIYLALQVRQAERNQRALIQQGRASRATDLLIAVAQPNLVGAYYKVGSGSEEVSVEEVRQFAIMFRASLYGFEDAYFQHKAKLLDDDAFESTVGTIRGIMANLGMRAAWEQQRDAHEPGFRRFMDDLIRGEPSPGSDTLEEWKRALASVRAPLSKSQASRTSA